MPELPEVETTRAALADKISGKSIDKVSIRHYGLRWPIPTNLADLLHNQNILSLKRRAKYLLFNFHHGTLIVHLGMSGCLRLLSQTQPAGKHDHIDIIFADGQCLRYTDPRRFGAFLWCENDPLTHPLLSALGPEPLSSQFSSNYLYTQCKNRRLPIKSFIMNSQLVVGVGNIYASESLYLTGIHPLTPAKALDQEACNKLTQTIKKVLKKAIAAGGTTLNDFYQTDGKPGYFQNKLQVYGRAGEACLQCKSVLEKSIIGQRSTFFCPTCQPLTQLKL